MVRTRPQRLRPNSTKRETWLSQFGGGLDCSIVGRRHAVARGPQPYDDAAAQLGPVPGRPVLQRPFDLAEWWAVASFKQVFDDGEAQRRLREVGEEESRESREQCEGDERLADWRQSNSEQLKIMTEFDSAVEQILKDYLESHGVQSASIDVECGTGRGYHLPPNEDYPPDEDWLKIDSWKWEATTCDELHRIRYCVSIELVLRKGWFTGYRAVSFNLSGTDGGDESRPSIDALVAALTGTRPVPRPS